MKIMKVYLLYSDIYDEVIDGIYTREALDKRLKSFLPYAEKQRKDSIEALLKGLSPLKSEKFQKIKEQFALVEKSKTFEDKHNKEYKEIRKEVKSLGRYILSVQKKINVLEEKIDNLKSLTEDELLQRYLNSNYISYYEYHLIGME